MSAAKQRNQWSEKRSIEVLGGMASIPLTKGKYAVIDADDLHLVSGKSWAAAKRGNTYYAKSDYRINGERKAIYMHRVILGVESGLVDHIDGNGLNNRKANLRQASHSLNAHNSGIGHKNTSGFKGVSWSKACGKWKAEITRNKRKMHLGVFDSPEDASRAYQDTLRSIITEATQ